MSFWRDELWYVHRLREKHDFIAFANGCFDLLHAGHLDTLNHAFGLAKVFHRGSGIVVVGLNSDDSISRSKGPGRPIVPYAQRLRLLQHLTLVDYTFGFDEETPLELIHELRPDVIVKSSEYRGKNVVGEGHTHVSFARHREGLSTTDIIERIRSGER